MELSGVTILKLLGQVESYLSILLLDQDVKIIFPGLKRSLFSGFGSSKCFRGKEKYNKCRSGCVCTTVCSEIFSVLVWKTVFSTLSK